MTDVERTRDSLTTLVLMLYIGVEKDLLETNLNYCIRTLISKQTKVVQLLSGMLKITLRKQKNNLIIKHSTKS